MNPNFYTVLVIFLMAFAFTLIFERILLPILKKHRAAHPILEIGPRWHLSKAGTPTLGGLGFVAGIGLTLLIFGLYLVLNHKQGNIKSIALVFVYGVLCGAIGFIDDYQKLVKRENKGLTATQKYVLQLIVSALFLVLAKVWLGTGTAVIIPFSNRVLELGIFYYPLSLLYLTGLVNACNLTDGVDGLLSTTVGVLSIFFIAWGVLGGGEVQTAIGSALLGGCCGFLCFNAHPAKVFMGDTGSLFLGAVVSAIGVVSANPIIVLLACGVFALEAISVILQVVWFKVSKGKRLLRMAPLHHHFEKCGWSEWRVVAVFAFVSLACATVSLLGV